jgi:hypothetical protein
MTQGHEIVDRGRADAGMLRRIHPVAEVEDVEAPEEALGGGSGRHAPPGPQRVRERQPDRSQLDLEPRERRADPFGAPDARRRERDDLVLASGRLHEAAEGPSDVVADPEQRVGQRADVEDDSHGAGS